MSVEKAIEHAWEYLSKLSWYVDGAGREKQGPEKEAGAEKDAEFLRKSCENLEHMYRGYESDVYSRSRTLRFEEFLKSQMRFFDDLEIEASVIFDIGNNEIISPHIRKIERGESASYLYDSYQEESSEIDRNHYRTALKNVFTGSFTAFLLILSHIYNEGQYDEIVGLGRFKFLLHSPMFSLGIFWADEFMICGRMAEECGISEKEISVMKVVVKKILSDNRDILYENLKDSSGWILTNGFMPRDLYLDAILSHFEETDADEALVMAVNAAVSPCGMSMEPDIEERIDEIIERKFSVLPGDLKNEIVERCTYKEVSDEYRGRETWSTSWNPCPEKVLNPVIRRHVVAMIRAAGNLQMHRESELPVPVLYRDGEPVYSNRKAGSGFLGDDEELVRLKFSCIDCAYVSAVLKEFANSLGKENPPGIKPDIGKQLNEEQIDELRGRFRVKDSHDDLNSYPSVFHITWASVHVLTVSLEKDIIKIHIHKNAAEDEEGKETGLDVDFQMDDWELAGLKNHLGEIAKSVLSYRVNPNGSDFCYSLVHLENYRCIESVTVSFDHRYAFSHEGGKVCLEKAEDRSIPRFYGRKILSLTGIVGKNGSGKTSVTDFLRESFIKICDDLYLEKLYSEDGVVKFEPGGECRYRLTGHEGNRANSSEITRFFVIFRLEGQYYYLTNMNLVNKGGQEDGFAGGMLVFENKAGVLPYELGRNLPMHYENRKIVYFSMYLPPDGVADEERLLLEREAVRQLSGGGYVTNARVSELAFPSRGLINLSEEWLNKTRSEGADEMIQLNASLFMQLVFYFCAKDSLGQYFKENFSVDSLEVRSEELGNYLNEDEWDQGETVRGQDASVKLADLTSKTLMIVLSDYKAYIRPLSSGQYSKFSILSRLYWCLEGWRTFSGVFDKQGFVPNYAWGSGGSFNVYAGWRDVLNLMTGSYLRQSDAAILFFDESDAYYHPEWQREFVNDIIDMVNRCQKNPVQVIFTTNSPLMLSDLRQEDIYLMRDTGRKADGHGKLLKGKDNPSVLTFGQNIHTLMANPFFLKRTIGRFADEQIEWLISLLIDVSDIIRFLRKTDEDDRDLPRKKIVFLGSLAEKQPSIYSKVIELLFLCGDEGDGEHERAGACENGIGDGESGSGDGKNGIKDGSVWSVSNRKSGEENEAENAAGILTRLAANASDELIGRSEKKYVNKRVREKYFDEGSGGAVPFAAVEDVLVRHIKMIGEDVLRHELFDMYNDFIARIKGKDENPLSLGDLIAQKERELELLRKKRGEDA